MLLHGAGTDRASALRLLASALPPGVEPMAETHDGSIASAVAAVDRLDQALRDAGRTLQTVGGISVGAHAAATWAARDAGRSPQPDLVLAMPAWTGEAGPIAALTAATADEVARDGIDAILARLVAEAGDDWVVDELVRSWTGADPAALPAGLRAAAAGAAPTLDGLARIRARTAVVALADDPLHPVEVAEAWAAAIPDARLVVVPRGAPGVDRGALGAAARSVLSP